MKRNYACHYPGEIQVYVKGVAIDECLGGRIAREEGAIYLCPESQGGKE